jgi:V/A-type H+-transporting ATPase subunit K
MVDVGSGMVAVGAAIAIGASALGTAMAQKSIGAAGIGLMAEKEGQFNNVLIFLALPETIVILGFVVAFLMLNKV